VNADDGPVLIISVVIHSRSPTVQPTAFEDRGDSQLISELGNIRATIGLGLAAGEPGPETSNNSGNDQQNTLGSLPRIIAELRIVVVTSTLRPPCWW
jgi:hypothetical protein